MSEPAGDSPEATTDECLRTESPPLKKCENCGAQGSFQQIRLIRKGLKRGEKPKQWTWGYKCVNRQCSLHFGSSYRFNKESLSYVECQHDGMPFPSPESAIIHMGLPLQQVADQSESPARYSEVPCTSMSLSDGNELEEQSPTREVFFGDVTTIPLFSENGSNEKEESDTLDGTVDVITTHDTDVPIPSVSKSRSRRQQRLSKKSYVPPRPIVARSSVTESSNECADFAVGCVPQSPQLLLDTELEGPTVKQCNPKVHVPKSGCVNNQDPVSKLNLDSVTDGNLKTSLKKLPKGYAYEPIDPDRVTVAEDQPNPQEVAITPYIISRNKTRKEAYDEGTQTGCELHKRVIALQNIITDPYSPGQATAENANQSVPALLARTIRNSQTIIKEQRAKIDYLEKERKDLMETLTTVKPFIQQFTHENKMFLDNVKADVDHMCKELKFFKMECQSEAQCSFDTFKQKQKRMEEALRYRTAERNKFKAQMDLTKSQLEQSKKTADCLHLDMEDKNLEVRQAKKKVEDTEKKLSDSMWIRTNQRCMKCKATESCQKTLIQEVIDAKKEVKKAGRELGGNKTKMEELERHNEWMAAEMERLHFEHRAYKKDNERLLAENEQFRKGLVPRALQMAIGNTVSEGSSDVAPVNGCQCKVDNINVLPQADVIDAHSGNESRGSENRIRPDTTDSCSTVDTFVPDRRARLENQNCQNSDNRGASRNTMKSPKQGNDNNRNNQDRDKDIPKCDSSSKPMNGDSSRKRSSTAQQRMDNKVFRSSDSERHQSRVISKTSERDEKQQSFNDYSRTDRHSKGRSSPRNQQSSRDRPSSRDQTSFRDRPSSRNYSSSRDRSPTREHVPFRDRPSSRDSPLSRDYASDWDRLPAWEHVPNRDRPRPVNEQLSGVLQPWDRIPSQLPPQRVISPPVFPVHGHPQQASIYGHPHGSLHPFSQPQPGSRRAFIDQGLPWSRDHAAATGGFSGSPQDTHFQDSTVRRSFWDRF